MKQKILVGIFIILMCFMFLISNQSLAVTSTNEYTIQSYNINMIVNEDNTFDIAENINVYFNVSKHGIFRKIPLKNSVTRIDGSKSNNRAKITNINVSENYTTYNENGYKVIKIGNTNSTLIGRHSYTIKYKYNIGKDPLKNADELYFNLIGDEWDANISNVSFTITMPKSFDKSTLGFPSGDVGSTNSSNVIYNVNGNTITGNTTNTLYAGQALTVRLTLPEGYFVGASSNIDLFSIFVIALCAVFVLIADRLWTKYGKDDAVIETVEFYPPEGYNSAEVGFLYKGSADKSSVISLLIYLANKGYLKIEETEEKGLRKKSKGFKITKIKEYDGNNECEKLFFNGLFKGSRNLVNKNKARKIMQETKNNGEKISFQDAIEMSMDNDSIKTSVTASDLYNNFYMTVNRIEQKLNSKENKSKIFESPASGKRKWLILMIIVIFILITAKPVLEYGEPDEILFASLLLLSFSYLCMIKAIKDIFLGVIGLLFSFLPLSALTQNSMHFIMYVIGIINIAVIILFAKIMPKRTAYGNEILGKLRGFKRFIETAEKLQLESLVTQNPEYFYNILPYAYALGVSDVWISQFETIALQAPNWYDSTDTFNMHSFGIFMTTTMASASTAMSSNDSGGGSGGGGGGSW